MTRVGVRFVDLDPSARMRLDRYLFQRMREEARTRRHLRGLVLQTPQERRRAHRVSTRELQAVTSPPAREDHALSASEQARLLSEGGGGRAQRPVRVDVRGISATGCGLLVPPELGLERGDELRLRLTDEGFEVTVSVRVVHVGDVGS